MWNTNTQSSPTTGGGMFGFGQGNTGTGMGFNNNQPATGTGIFGNQPTTSPGTGLFNSGFNNPSGGGAIAMPSSQQTPTFGGFGMQSTTNTMSGSQPTGTGLFNMGTTSPMGGMNTGMGTGMGAGMAQTPSLFSPTPLASNTGGMFGATTGTGGGMFGNTGNTGASNGAFGTQPVTGGSLFNTPSSTFGQPANTGTTGSPFFGNMGNTMAQPTNNTLFGGTPNTQNGIFNTAQNNQSQTTMFGKPTSGFLGNNQPTNSNFSFNNNNNNTNANTFNTSMTTTSTFNPNNAKSFQPKKFQPTKPKNETVSKEKNSNSLVACITNTDEYHQFCKDELRIMYLINPAQFQVTQQSTPFGQTSTSFNQPSNSMFNQPNNTIGQSGGMFNQPTNSLFNPMTSTQPQTTGIFNQTPSFGGNTNSNPLFGNTNNSNSLFGSQNTNTGLNFAGNATNNNTLFGTNNPLDPNSANQANKMAASLFAQSTSSNPTTGGLFQTPANNTGATTGLFGATGGSGGLFNTPNQTPMFGNQQAGSLFPASNTQQNSGNSLFPGGSLFNTPTTQQPGSLFSTPANTNILNNPQAQQAITGSMSMFGANNQGQQSGSLFGSGSLFPQNQQQNQGQSLFPSGSLFPNMNNSQGGQGNAYGNLSSGTMPTRKNIFSSTSYYESNNSVPSRPVTAVPTDSLFISTPAVTQMSNLIATDLMSSLREDKRVNITNRYYSQEVEDYERARREIQRRFDDDIVSKLGPNEFGYVMPDYSSVEYNFNRRNSRDPEKYNDYVPTYMTRKTSSLRYQQPQVFVRDNMEESYSRPNSTLRSHARESVFSNRPQNDDEYDSRANLRKASEPVDNSSFKKRAAFDDRKDEIPTAPATDKLASIEDIPVCRKFNIKPSLVELSRMTKDQLKRVANLELWNNYGKIEWTHPVNLVGVNLDDWVTIRQSSVEIEEELACGGGCIMHFYNFGNYTEKSKNPSNSRNFKSKMTQWLRDRHLKMISFSDETGELVATYDG